VSLEMTVKIQWQKEQISLLKQRIKRLEEAGDRAIENSYYPDRVKVWNKAKEAKP
jgi:hypothetical protein